MEDVQKHVEKIYCCDRGDNDNALAAAILANHGNRDNNDALYALLANQRNQSDPALTAMMANGGMNGQWNNPFVYLVWMMFAARFWNNNGCNDGNGGCGNNAQLQAIQTQMQDNQNANLIRDAVQGNTAAIGQLSSNLNCDFNTLNSAICDVKNAISQVGGAVGFSAERIINAVNMGDCNVIQALNNCCCTIQRQIADFRADVQLQMCQQTGELRNGQRDLGQAITQGFSQVGYATQQQTCDLINNQNANTQRLVDLLNNHWNEENQRKIQDLKFELSQERQNNLLLNRLGGYNNTCGCGYNNCGYNNCGCGC